MRRMTRIALVALTLAGGCLVLSACSAAHGKQARMDHDAIVTRIGTTPGVTHAEVRPFNLGAPGSNALAVVIDVDHTGDAALGDVIVTAVRSVAEHASGFRDYEFTVNVPGAAGLEVERLRDRRTEIPIDVGTYQGSALILTEAELRRAAG